MSHRIALACALAILVTVTSAAADVAGAWALAMRFPNQNLTSTGVCEIAQEGNTLSGWCGGPEGEDAFDVVGESGEGDAVGFRFIDADGFVRMEFSGEFGDGEIRGACRVTGGELCTFTASRP